MADQRNSESIAAEKERVEQQQPLITHLMELRDRILAMVYGVVIVFIPLAFFAADLYALLALPLLEQLPSGTSMIATGVISPFFTPFKFAFVLAIFLTVPWWLYQIWSFIAPGLYDQEQRLVFPLLMSSSLLFYLGTCFAYFVVFPLVFGFVTTVAPEGVVLAPDMASYLDLVLSLFFAFGLAFEVPIAIILMVKTGFTTPGSLKEKRGYVLIGAFVVGMLLTPPDVISQTLLAVPVYLLFELGIILSAVLVPGSKEVDAQRAEQAAADSMGKPGSDET